MTRSTHPRPGAGAAADTRMEPSTILAVKLSSLGDIVHATPCVRALRRAHPAARIIMAVDQRFADVVRHDPNVNRLIEARRGSPWATWVQARRELGDESGTGFDLAIDFQGTWRSATWTYASGARVKGGRGGFRPGWHKVLRPDLSRHAVRVCADISERVGVAVADLNPALYVGEEDERVVGHLLKERGLPGEGFVVFNPFSRWTSKVWPFERYAELARRVRESANVVIIVSGGPGEEAHADELMRLMGRGDAVSLAGKLTLGQSMSLFKRARLMVTGDTGPMHVAAALGTRVVALFGPTFPERTGPWGEGHTVLQALRPPRHQAYRDDPGGTYMRAIELDGVCRAVLDALGRGAA